MIIWPDIIKEHGPLVWKTAYRLLGNRSDAEDCYQEAFISAVLLARRKTINDWPGLLIHLTTKRAVDLLRKNRKHRIHCAGDCLNDELKSGEAGPVAQAQASELVQQLRDALGQLPASHAELFSLHYVSKLTNQQIAELMGMSASHIGVKLYRIRRQLCKLLNIETTEQPREVVL